MEMLEGFFIAQKGIQIRKFFRNSLEEVAATPRIDEARPLDYTVQVLLFWTRLHGERGASRPLKG
jgi:hypothetical protein